MIPKVSNIGRVALNGLHQFWKDWQCGHLVASGWISVLQALQIFILEIVLVISGSNCSLYENIILSINLLNFQ